MTNAKMTKKEMFTMIKGLEVVKDNAEMVAFLEHEIELLEKKSSKSGQTKTQKENEPILALILESLEGLEKAVTITELQNEVAELEGYSNQKISALMKKLVDSGKVVKTTDKKKSYFSLA